MTDSNDARSSRASNNHRPSSRRSSQQRRFGSGDQRSGSSGYSSRRNGEDRKDGGSKKRFSDSSKRSSSWNSSDQRRGADHRPHRRFDDDARSDRSDRRSGRSDRRSEGFDRSDRPERSERRADGSQRNARRSSQGYRRDRKPGGLSQNRSDRRGRFDRNSRPGRHFDKPRTRREDREDSDQERILPPGLQPAKDEPPLPANYSDQELPAGIRAELRGLNRRTAEVVGGHLTAAGELIEIDPQLALRHAMVARRLASRLPIIREFTAEVAYAAGDFDVALTEYRAIHRMNGSDNYLPVIADCQRATGRLDAALRTIREAAKAKLTGDQKAELILVEAGIRNDMDQRAEALRLLKDAIVSKKGHRVDQARFRFAYGEILAQAGQTDPAIQWLRSAASYDERNELAIDERIAELEGQPYDADEFEVLDVALPDEPEELDERAEPAEPQLLSEASGLPVEDDAADESEEILAVRESNDDPVAESDSLAEEEEKAHTESDSLNITDHKSDADD